MAPLPLRARRTLAALLAGPACVGGAAAGLYGGHDAGRWLDQALGHPFGIPTGFITLGTLPISLMLLGLLLGWAGAGWAALRFAGGLRGAVPLLGLLGCSACFGLLCGQRDWGSLAAYGLAVSALTSGAGVLAAALSEAGREPG